MDVTSYLLGKKSGGGGPTPTGTINITENGTHDVTNYASANVNVSGGTDTRWQEIGYDEEPSYIQEGIDYAKEIMQNWDPNITDRINAFYNDSKIKFFPNVDTSKVTRMGSMFYGSGVMYVGDLDLSSIATGSSGGVSYMFYSCKSLVEVGDFILPPNVRCQSVFYECQNLKKIGKITLGSGSFSDNVFYRCPNLEEIKELNFTGTTSNVSFGGCTKLSNNSLKAILKGLKQLTAQSTKTLKAMGLTQEQAELCTTFNEWTELENAGWTTGY